MDSAEEKEVSPARRGSPVADLPSADPGPGGTYRPPSDPVLIPCMLLRRGQVYLPGDDGPQPAKTPEGGSYDPFDVVDRLVRTYSVIYIVDLDGIEKAEPQLDYLQELSREATVWADAGVRSADQAIDVLVAGAARAVLSSSTLEGPRELKRAWRLSSDLVFEIEVDSRGPRLWSGWPAATLSELALSVRGTGLQELVLSPRGMDVDWGTVRQLADGGPIWVDGSFDPNDAAQLAANRASGGIFHLNGLLEKADAPLPSASSSTS